MLKKKLVLKLVIMTAGMTTEERKPKRVCLKIRLNDYRLTSHKYLCDKSFEYLHFALFYPIDFFVDDKGMFKVVINKTNVKIHCFVL